MPCSKHVAAGLLMLLGWSALAPALHGQGGEAELPHVGRYRQEVNFRDPYQDLPEQPEAVQEGRLDSTRRKLQLNASEPPNVAELLFRYSNERDTVQRGYRVQIYLGKRANATDARFKFMKHFDNVALYTNYEQPFYKVRAGNFMTRLEAQRFLARVREHFPDAFIVPTTIESPY